MIAEDTVPGAACSVDVASATAVADHYNLLALFLQFPADRIVAGLADGSIEADWLVICREEGLNGPDVQSAADELRAARREAESGALSFDDLRRDYTRLFNHPDRPAVPLYEGMFIDRVLKPENPNLRNQLLFVNAAALDAERCYRKAGLKRSPDVNVPADCMATEMEFMSHVHALKAQAIAGSDAERAAEATAWIEEFERLHLSKWGRAFFDRCTSESKTPFYRAVGLMGRALMRETLGPAAEGKTAQAAS